MICRRVVFLGGVAAALFLAVTPHAWAARCGTGERRPAEPRFAPLRPVARAAGREAVPVDTGGAHVRLTEHFRVVWGDGYDPSDPDWADPDGDGVPVWVDVLAEALETAHAIQSDLGFPEPYGSDRYYLDAYVANTGVQKDGVAVTVGSSYYAYTDVNAAYDTAYFVFNDDFSAHADDELGVLRATAAHELFHAVQRADYPWDDEHLIPDVRWDAEGWWFEATATWMEEVCAPDVDDYVGYVREFLAEPWQPLASRDGLREYGAAIFPGYLWLREGGAPLWRAVFEGAWADGVDGALDAALGGRLGQAVAAFWTFAAHPEDLWPDGSGFDPRVWSSDGVPVDLDLSGYRAAGRLGANLVRIGAVHGTVWGAVEPVDPDGEWAVGVAGPSGDPPELVTPSADPSPWSQADGAVYLAVVNLSGADGDRPARLWVSDTEDGPPREAPTGADPGEAPSGGGTGGCFLTAIGRPSFFP